MLKIKVNFYKVDTGFAELAKEADYDETRLHQNILRKKYGYSQNKHLKSLVLTPHNILTISHDIFWQFQNNCLVNILVSNTLVAYNGQNTSKHLTEYLSTD